MTSMQLNQQVPNFQLKNVTGEDFTFSDVQQAESAWHLLVYFRGSWCPACQKELKQLQEEQADFNEHDIHIITITHDDEQNLKDMADEHGLTFPILLDEEYSFLKDYEVYYHGEEAPYEDHGNHPEPAYFLVDNHGNLLYQQRQTNPFGRPHADELKETIKYIRKNLK
ncbi:peroxiredoxin family protein [Salimicrobium halophilum]|uniref:Peroxiredoxin n=1 Tax=Salimicrobium halophilum TaxID=86666 RepID=A0A1G8TQF9_9BACI|nr:redoxin domain-containing protein [Salimicrobium halophilum]SDJ43653.1 Peroxiredoxin [Salimicrobium halophilum]